MSMVSIVIPTRNRAHLLRSALKSAVEQTFRDIQIVVCDNASVDKTRDVVHSYTHDGLRYVRTDKTLSMPDNWDFALRHADGEYITYLTDDAYLLPHCIETVIRELKQYGARVGVWKHCAYFTPEWLEPGRRNIVYVPRSTLKSYLLESKTQLSILYSRTRKISSPIPKSLNSICHRSIVNKVIGIQRRFFLPPCPDFTSAASVMLNVPEYLVIDQPMFVDGVTTSSIGATSSFSLGDSNRSFIEEFGQELRELAFLGIPTPAGSVAKSLENVREYYLETCPEIDKNNLLYEMVDSLMKLESNGVDVDNYLQVLGGFIAKQPMSLRMKNAKHKVISRCKWRMMRIVRSSPRLERIEMLRSFQILRGSEWDFCNIENCSRAVLRLLYPSVASTLS